MKFIQKKITFFAVAYVGLQCMTPISTQIYAAVQQYQFETIAQVEQAIEQAFKGGVK